MPAAGTAPLQLVFGASGYIGSNLVPRLLAAGHRVRATARNVEVLEARGWDGSRTASQADALDPATLPAALAGVDVAYYLVHSMAAGRDFGAHRPRGGRQLRPGRGRGRRAPHRLPRRPDPAQSPLGAPAARAPRQAKCCARAACRSRRCAPGMIIGPGSAAYEVIRDLVNHLPVMVTPRWVRSRSTPIALATCSPTWLPSRTSTSRRQDARRRRAGHRDLRGRSCAATAGWSGQHPLIIAGAGADAATLVVLAAARHVRAHQHRAGAGGRSRARFRRARRRICAPRAAPADWGSRSRCARRSTRTASTRSSRAGSRARSRAATSTPSTRFYAMRAGATATGDATPEPCSRTVCTIGGERGCFFANLLWWIRRAMDWLVGGPSFRRSRRHPTRAARRRRRGFVARHRARARAAAHAADGNEGAGRRGARVRRAAAGPGRASRPRPTGIRPACWAWPTGTRWFPRTRSSSGGCTRAILRRAAGAASPADRRLPRGIALHRLSQVTRCVRLASACPVTERGATRRDSARL